MPEEREDPLARLGPAAFAVATLLLHVVCWGRYGIFRDELYFIACGERLAAGYVDQPPGIALVARLVTSAFGTWVPGLRLVPWLVAAATVYLSGRLAARLGGGAAGASLAAAATFACPVLLATGHLLTMNAFEPFLVLALVHVLARVARGEDPRLWVAAGGIAGLAVLFKYTAALVALALLAGLLATPARRALRSGYTLAGAAVGLGAILPNFVWQAIHGFPFLEVARNGLLYKNTPTNPLQFLGEVLFEANPGNAPLWLGGLAWLLLARTASPVRFAGLGALAYLLLQMFVGGKPYYVASVLPVLLGAGGVALATVLRRCWLRIGYGSLLCASALALAPLALPILPVETLVRYQALGFRTRAMERTAHGILPQIHADQFGWRELVAAVARVYASLPAAERDRATIFGRNYGVAAAVDVYGSALGLPPRIAISGHNQYWLWGLPPGRSDPVIAVSGPKETCGGLFRQMAVAERLPHNPYAMPYEDQHWIWICRDPVVPFWTMPEAAKNYQ